MVYVQSRLRPRSVKRANKPTFGRRAQPALAIAPVVFLSKFTENKTKGLKLHRHDLSIKTKKCTPKHGNIPQKPRNIPKNMKIYPKVKKYTKT